MRIGIDARLTYYRPGGIAEYTRHIIAELADLAPQHTYLILHSARDRSKPAPIPGARRISVLTPCHHRLERWALSAELIPRRLDLLHTPDVIPPQHGARRHVITIHDLHFLLYPQFMTAESLRHYAGQIEWAVRHADHILVSSHATQRDLQERLRVPAEQVSVHHLGVEASFAPLAPDAIAAARTRLKLPERYFLFVGTFEPRKNLPGLFNAYRHLSNTEPDLPPLVLAGRRGWLYDDIFARAAALGLDQHLIWIENPAQADLPALYNGAVTLLLPSFYEGFGLTALEAMACGTPPIVANRSSLPEVVGNAGLLVDPEDPEDLAAAMRRLLTDSDLRAELRAAGLTRAATFTWRKTAETVLQAYQRVCTD